MKRNEHPLSEPGRQWSWKITLTILCAIVGAIIVLYLAGVLTGCASPDYAAKRRQQQLAISQPGITSRADVQKRWPNSKPDLSETRPGAGWVTSTNPAVRVRAVASEQRI